MTFTISGRLVRWPSYPRTAVCLKCDLWVTDSYWQTAWFRCYAAARRLSEHGGPCAASARQIHGFMDRMRRPPPAPRRLDGDWERSLQPWDIAAGRSRRVPK